MLLPFAHSPPPELQPHSRARICLSLSDKDLEGRSSEIRATAALSHTAMKRGTEGLTHPQSHTLGLSPSPCLPVPYIFPKLPPSTLLSPHLLSLQIRKLQAAEWSDEDACGAAPLPQADSGCQRGRREGAGRCWKQPGVVRRCRERPANGNAASRASSRCRPKSESEARCARGTSATSR